VEAAQITTPESQAIIEQVTDLVGEKVEEVAGEKE